MAALLLDSEQLSEEACCRFVRSGSFGKIAYWVTDERVAQLHVRYGMDAGTIVCGVPEPALDASRLVPIAFEAYGCDADGYIWSVLIQGRARRIWRAEDLEIVAMLPLPARQESEGLVRVIVDTVTGTRSASRPSLTMPLQPQSRDLRPAC